MYGFEPPRQLKPNWLVSLEECPAVDGAGSKTPDANLVRWKAVSESFKDWYESGDPPDVVTGRQFSWMDPVQKDITAALFATARRLLPRRTDETIDWDPPSHEIGNAELNGSLRAFVQWAVSGPDGRELFKLKTGRRGTSEAELAVLVAGMPDEGGTLVEMSLVDGDLRSLTLDRDTVASTIERLWDIWRTHKNRDDKARDPGLHCYVCPRPARCGQYPTVGGKATSRTRTVTVSKTWLEKLDVCERQVAWKRLYGIPDDDEVPQGSGAARTGSAFHELIASALLADDPAAAFADAVRTAEVSERQHLVWLFERHQELSAKDPYPVTYPRTEYDMGVTLLVPGIDIDRYDKIRDTEVAVVLMCRVDGAGREVDGTPVVVEHRTGESATQKTYETDLYAVSAALAVKSDTAAVHVHRLGLQDGPVCERTLYDRAALDRAANRLKAAARRIAAWHPADATAPTYTVGTWCMWCPVKERCERHRQSNPQPGA